MGLTHFASGSRVIELSEHLGFGKSTIMKIMHKFVVALLAHRSEYILCPMDVESLACVK